MAINGVNNDVVIKENGTQVQQTQEVKQEEQINSTFTADEAKTDVKAEGNSVFTGQQNDNVYGDNGIELSNYLNTFSRSSSNVHTKDLDALDKRMAEALFSGDTKTLNSAKKRRQHTNNVGTFLKNDKKQKEGLSYSIRLADDYDNSQGNNEFSYKEVEELLDTETTTTPTTTTKTTKQSENAEKTSNNNLAVEGNVKYKTSDTDVEGSVFVSSQRLVLNGSALYNPTKKTQLMASANVSVKGTDICGKEQLGVSYSNPEKKFGTGLVGSFEHVLTHTDEGNKSFANANVQGYMNAGKHFSVKAEYDGTFALGHKFHMADVGLETRGEKTFKTKNDGFLTLYGSLSAAASYEKVSDLGGFGFMATAESGLTYKKNDFSANVNAQANYNGSFINELDIGYDDDYDVSVSGSISKKQVTFGVGYSLSSDAEYDSHTFNVGLGYTTPHDFKIGARFTKKIDYDKIEGTAYSNANSNLLSLDLGLPIDGIVDALRSSKLKK